MVLAPLEAPGLGLFLFSGLGPDWLQQTENMSPGQGGWFTDKYIIQSEPIGLEDTFLEAPLFSLQSQSKEMLLFPVDRNEDNGQLPRTMRGESTEDEIQKQ